ncbi:MAG: RNA polymerase-binding protein RbpA [Actinomycetota bacterium]|nr:RNA polymerase-binding protein RbpA [Actinomycetota bacterium]
MKSATMRGTGLGAISYESDRVSPAPESEIVRYVCAQGHQSVIPFSIEAEEIPVTWMCRCGREARAAKPVPKMSTVTAAEPRAQRTHWDMLRERRTIAELQELLKERLTLLHSQLAKEQLLSA